MAATAALVAGALAVAEAIWTAVVDAALVGAPVLSADEPPEHAGESIAAPGAARRRTSNDKRFARISLVLMSMVGSYPGRLRPPNPDLSLTLSKIQRPPGRPAGAYWHPGSPSLQQTPSTQVPPPQSSSCTHGEPGLFLHSPS